MNWYEGKELLFLFDFIFSFYFLTLYFNENSDFNNTDNNTYININIMNTVNNTDILYNAIPDNNKLRAIFYIFIFCFFLVLLISSYRKGKIFMVNYFILFVGFVFLFLDNFFEDKYDCIKKTHYYIFIISGGLMWIIGIFKLINNGFLSKEETILLGKTD